MLAESPEPFATETREKRAALAHFEPKNLLISHGSERAERRRFHEEALDSHHPVHRLADGFLHVVNSEAEHLRKGLRSPAELTWAHFSDAWFRIVRQVVLGRAARDDNQLSRIMAKLRSSGNWAFLWPRRRGLRDQFRNRIRGYLEQADPDSLSGIMARFHADGEIAPEHQVPQWLFAFDPAGMTTFRTLALLATHPKHARIAREEITHDTGAQGLSFLRAAVLESLRLWPTSPLVLRESTQPTAWETGVIPAHAGIVIYSPFFHRDNERLPYADKFSPEIWLDSTTGPAGSLIPFSKGPAICPRRNLVLVVRVLTGPGEVACGCLAAQIMRSKNNSHRSPLVLLLIDVINHFEFPDGDRTLRQALPIAPRIARLKQRAKAAGIATIYVNDNFGQWRSDATRLVNYCLRPDAVGKDFVEQIRPGEEDYFVLKPMHSAFYQTPLEALLRYLAASSLILCGLATNSCIVCTAHDAYMREFRFIVPPDCSAARSAREHQQAIRHIAAMTEAQVIPSSSLRLQELVRQASRVGSPAP